MRVRLEDQRGGDGRDGDGSLEDAANVCESLDTCQSPSDHAAQLNCLNIIKNG